MLKRIEIWLAIVLSALYVFLSVIVWKRQGFDVSLAAVGFIGTAVLWCVLIVAIVRTRSAPHTDARHIPDGEHPMPVPEARTKEEWTESTGRLKLVANRKFAHTDVHLDGRHYINCSFEHVRFWYDGTQPCVLEESTLDADSRTNIHTHNPALAQWTQMLRGLGLLVGDIKMALDPLADES